MDSEWWVGVIVALIAVAPGGFMLSANVGLPKDVNPTSHCKTHPPILELIGLGWKLAGPEREIE